MKSHILVVDDNPKNIQLLGNLLQNSDYEIEYALNGRDALYLVANEQFDLILLDIMMPEMDGFEVCKRLKMDEVTRDIPIIFLSARAQSESIVEGFKLGAADYVSKPFDQNELLARISTHLALRNAQMELAKKNKILLDSINYARRIQNSMLPESEYWEQLLGEYVLFVQPKDIVSGDFFWIDQYDNQIVMAVGDGTGHGVPGAFMSMLGMSLLNEIIPRSNLEHPGKILDQLRKGVKRALQQTGRDHESQDGMDIALCIYNSETMKLRYAGAFNPVYILRDNKLHELKGDRQPIAIHYNETEFSTQEYQLQNGDAVYLFSDGFADQFGGKANTKLLKRNFKKLLLQASNHHMKDQHSIIKDQFLQWKGDNEQIDDVIVFGFRAGQK